MHVFLIITRVTAAARIVIIQAVVVVDAIDIVSSRDLAQRALDLIFSLRGSICDWWGGHWGRNGCRFEIGRRGRIDTGAENEKEQEDDSERCKRKSKDQFALIKHSTGAFDRHRLGFQAKNEGLRDMVVGK